MGIDDESLEFNEIEEIKYQEKISLLKKRKRIEGYLLLFEHWLSYGDAAAKRIHTYFKENHNLDQMLKEFEKIEEYEKCAVIRDWRNEIFFLEKKFS
jgi:hypothetical protein